MSSFNSILIPVDFSDCCRYGTAYGASLAERLDSEVHLAHVVDTGYVAYAAMYGANVVIDPSISSVEEAAQKRLSEERAELTTKGINVTTHLAKGAPVDQLLRLATEQNCGLIVTSTCTAILEALIPAELGVIAEQAVGYLTVAERSLQPR